MLVSALKNILRRIFSYSNRGELVVIVDVLLWQHPTTTSNHNDVDHITCLREGGWDNLRNNTAPLGCTNVVLVTGT